MTAASIGAAKGGGYARYLESKTVIPERGDYYLTPEGEPTQAPGRWLASLGYARAARHRGDDGGGQGLHRADGGTPSAHRAVAARRRAPAAVAGGGIDLTFSAPKSVSAVWALGDAAQRREHGGRARRGGGRRDGAPDRDGARRSASPLRQVVVEEPAVDLIAAEYRHTTARGVMEGDAPDPQLHSHVVVTSAVREDGRIVAVASRPIFRAAQGARRVLPLGARARARPARLSRSSAGRASEGRYFEIAGVPRGLLDAFSARSREVARAAERFRAKWGRAPERGELRALKLENRKAKVLVTRGDLQRAWNETAARFDYTGTRSPVARATASRRAGARSCRSRIASSSA